MPGPKTRIACIGECMIELSQIDLDRGAARVGFAGDTLNTATYLARLGADVSYVTNLGVDAFSVRMVDTLRTEGIDTTLIGRHDTRLPGLYSIEIDAQGERSFRYWRDSSAARTLFSGIGPSMADLDRFDVIYLSGITLAILPTEIRHALIAVLGSRRDQGCRIVFDSNYRPRLWADADTARAAFAAMWRVTSLALPSFDDEERLYPGTTPTNATQGIADMGVAEVVMKNGAAGAMIGHDGQILQTDFAVVRDVVDTSGAGDSFNAGYLAARLTGAVPLAAAKAGHRIASRVIGHHGAIIPKDAMP